ncbi:hypothetical protein NT6N_13340 [Oceaniferula spumae]|uniref:Uncharacterized protein n=1 Tax=Oceaniferula spumae TaxID=2979115 RepID=A0AAT9FJX0_9BACT
MKSIHYLITAATSFLAFMSPIQSGAETLIWNVKKEYGITAEGIQKAVQAAKVHFRKTPNDVIVLEFDEGSYNLNGKDTEPGTIDLGGVKPGPKGRLIFKGAGMDKTVLVFSDNIHAITGKNVYRVTMSDMHMTRKNYTVSQGDVVETSKGKVVLDIHEGFPTPMDIFNAKSDQGRYIRRYTNSKTDPQLVVKNNAQLAWKTATHLGGQRWQLNLVKKNVVPTYSKGDLLGIKSKHGGQTYKFMGGSDFIFKSIKWTQKTRGVFRKGFDKIQILDCVTERSAPINGQTPCLAAPGGGPQIGQPWDPPTKGNIVRNCIFTASGDDAVAFFHSTGEISGCQIRDAFARGILASNSPEAVIKDNKLLRCPIQRSKDHIMPDDLSELIE